MAIQPMALAVANPEINAVQAMSEGVQASQTAQNNSLVNAREAMKNIGSMAFGVMGGKIDGQADPQMWEQALDMLGQSGMNVDQFRGRSDLAPIVARASVDTLGQLSLAQNEQELEQRIKEFSFTVSEAAKGPAPTAEMRNYDWASGDPDKMAFMGKGPQAGARPLSPQERQEWGISADDNRPYAIEPGKAPSLVGGSGQTINVNTAGTDSELDKALSKEEGGLWAEYKKTGTVSSSNAQDFQVLDELIGVAPQGALPGRLASAFPGFNSAGDAFQSIVKRIAPTMRAPGSGSTSDIEYAGMLSSLPALQNDPSANRMILSIMKAKAEVNMQRSEIISRYQAKKLTVDDAREELDKLDRVSIVTPEMRQALLGVGATGEVGQAVPKAGEVVEGYEFIGGNPADQNSWRKVE